MNKDIISGKWTEIKGEIQKKWGSLTNDEVDKTQGDLKAMAGLLQQKYGLAKEEASEKLHSLYSRFIDSRQESVNQDIAEKKNEIKRDI